MKVYFGIKSFFKEHSGKNIICLLEQNNEIEKQCEQAGVTVIDLSLFLQDTASQIKYEFIDYISSIGKRQKNHQYWWASKIASKNNLQTEFYSLLCFLLVSKQIAEQKIAEHFITNDEKLFFLLIENSKALYRLSDLIRAYLRLSTSILYSLLRGSIIRIYFIIKTLCSNYVMRKYYSTLDETLVDRLYIYSWIEERSFTHGHYTDQYLPNVEKFSHSLETVLFCPYSVKPKVLSKFKNRPLITGLSRYSTFWHIINAICSISIVSDNKLEFRSNDLSILWLYEMLDENKKASFIGNIHDYNCWVDFFQTAKGKIVYPYENQPWEKMMLLAARNCESTISFIAYQHSTIGKLFLPYHTTSNELSYMPIPQTIVTNCETFKNIFENYFQITNTAIINGGALRYSYSSKRKAIASQITKIGCLLSVDKKVSSEIIKNINRFNEDGFEIYVKMHPDLYFNTDVFLPHVKVFHGTARELYAFCNFAIYANSSAGLEAYMNGLQVFKIRGNFIDLEMGEDLFLPRNINTLHEISLLRVEGKVFDCSLSLLDPIKPEIWQKLFN